MAKSISSTRTIWVAIDVSKRSHQVMVETPEGCTKRFRVQQKRKDYEAFAEFLKNSGEKVIIGLEATGDYHRTLAHYLLKQGAWACSLKRMSRRFASRWLTLISANWFQHRLLAFIW